MNALLVLALGLVVLLIAISSTLASGPLMPIKCKSSSSHEACRVYGNATGDVYVRTSEGLFLVKGPLLDVSGSTIQGNYVKRRVGGVFRWVGRSGYYEQFGYLWSLNELTLFGGPNVSGWVAENSTSPGSWDANTVYIERGKNPEARFTTPTGKVVTMSVERN